jgi:hypothetical protein
LNKGWMLARVMGPENKKRSSHNWDERFVRGTTQFRQPFNQKTRWCATGKRPASLITQVRQMVLRIPYTLITAVRPVGANRCLSLQQLRGPFNISVCAASHQTLLSVTP